MRLAASQAGGATERQTGGQRAGSSQRPRQHQQHVFCFSRVPRVRSSHCVSGLAPATGGRTGAGLASQRTDSARDKDSRPARRPWATGLPIPCRAGEPPWRRGCECEASSVQSRAASAADGQRVDGHGQERVVGLWLCMCCVSPVCPQARCVAVTLHWSKAQGSRFSLMPILPPAPSPTASVKLSAGCGGPVGTSWPPPPALLFGDQYLTVLPASCADDKPHVAASEHLPGCT